MKKLPIKIKDKCDYNPSEMEDGFFQVDSGGVFHAKNELSHKESSWATKTLSKYYFEISSFIVKSYHHDD